MMIYRRLKLIFISLIFLSFAINSFSQSSKFHIYGFFNTELTYGELSPNSEQRVWHFDQNFLNVLTNYYISDEFSIATEIEWENAARIGPDETIGRLNLAKSYLEYKPTDNFQLKFGRFLTPFGIYNERHDATPTFISSRPPQFIYDEHYAATTNHEGRLFNKFSTGIMLQGNYFHKDWKLRYQLYVTNNRNSSKIANDSTHSIALGVEL